MALTMHIIESLCNRDILYSSIVVLFTIGLYFDTLAAVNVHNEHAADFVGLND